MKLEFFKYQGTGNDFILVDNRQGRYPKDVKTIRFLCDRKFGIGSDGIIFIEDSVNYDFVMDFYNPDGSQSFCGNGSRCAVAFAQHLGIIRDSCLFDAIDGRHVGLLLGSGLVKVKMKDVPAVEVSGDFYFLNTGSPHYVAEVANIDGIDMNAYGKSVRYNERFKETGTNVNAIEKKDQFVRMRTYERGVEDETLSCGTGVTAVALVAMHKGWGDRMIHIKTNGGDLSVEATSDNKGGFDNIWLIGPAKQVFKGEIDV